MLRAPRRFKHPAWLPKQTLGRALDDRVAAFFSSRTSPPTTRRGPVEDGIRIVNTPGPRTLDVEKEVVADKEEDSEGKGGGDHDEDDEEGADDMIWWQWSAESIRGFADI